MPSVSMQDLEQFSYWQEKSLTSYHWYDIYNPVISVELTELADHVVANNDSVEEIQLDLSIQQLRVPAWNESLLMPMSDCVHFSDGVQARGTLCEHSVMSHFRL